MTPQEHHDLAVVTGINAGASMFEAAAVVGALAEAGLVDPLKVAAWADMFAEAQGKDMPEQIREGVAVQLRGFAGLLRSMATVPAGAGRGLNSPSYRSDTFVSSPNRR